MRWKKTACGVAHVLSEEQAWWNMAVFRPLQTCSENGCCRWTLKLESSCSRDLPASTNAFLFSRQGLSRSQTCASEECKQAGNPKGRGREDNVVEGSPRRQPFQL